jgi:hypothetical protein
VTMATEGHSDLETTTMEVPSTTGSREPAEITCAFQEPSSSTEEPLQAATATSPTEGLARAETSPSGLVDADAGEVMASVLEEIKEGTVYVTQAPQQPVKLELNLNRVWVEGAGVVLSTRLSCMAQDPLLDVCLQVSSEKALVAPKEERVTQIEHGDPADLSLELDLAERSMGMRNLNWQIAFTFLGRRKTMKGQVCVTILREPSSTNLRFDLSNIGNQVVNGASNAGLGSENRSELRLSELVDFSKIRTLNDLLGAELPTNLVAVPLRQISDEPTGARLIPPAFLKRSQEAFVLTLESSDTEVLPLRLVARSQFLFGRNRNACDLITWFLPRGKDHDSYTGSLGQVTAFATVDALGIHFRNRKKEYLCSLDETSLGIEEPGMPFTDQGRLSLVAIPGVSYQVDMQLHPAEGSAPPAAENGRFWSGPGVETKPATGCVVMRPVSWPVAFRNCIWLFTEAAFGSGADVPVHVPGAELSTVQGRIHHYRSCFWLENSAETGTVRVEGQRLRPGDLVPLCNGMKIQLGKLEFTARLEL